MIFLGGTVSEKCIETLEKMRYDVKIIPECKALPFPVSTHPDMVVYKKGETLFLQEKYYEENKSFFDMIKSSIVTEKKEYGKSYPNDILFNAFEDDEKNLYGNIEYISRLLKKDVNSLVFVKQGYAACSVCKLGKNAYITADKSIYMALLKNGKDTLLISSGHIELPCFEHGFIGGASVKLSDGLTAFFGKIEEHPDFEKMKVF